MKFRRRTRKIGSEHRSRRTWQEASIKSHF
jgi:hypothetical protein